jgi:outer membrane protein OmpA-like peptidoglycan-associated protein
MRRWLPLIVLMLLASVTTGSAHAAGARTFVLYFSSWSALIEPAAAEIVPAAVVAAKEDGNAPVSVTGYASTIGSAEANTLLSRLRAQVVSDTLVADGVDAKRITLTAVGPTTFLVEPVESRRAVIEIGAK